MLPPMPLQQQQQQPEELFASRACARAPPPPPLRRELRNLQVVQGSEEGPLQHLSPEVLHVLWQASRCPSHAPALADARLSSLAGPGLAAQEKQHWAANLCNKRVLGRMRRRRKKEAGVAAMCTQGVSQLRGLHEERIDEQLAKFEVHVMQVGAGAQLSQNKKQWR